MQRRLRSRSVHNFGTCVWRTAAQWRLPKKNVFRRRKNRIFFHINNEQIPLAVTSSTWQTSQLDKLTWQVENPKLVLIWGLFKLIWQVNLTSYNSSSDLKRGKRAGWQVDLSRFWSILGILEPFVFSVFLFCHHFLSFFLYFFSKTQPRNLITGLPFFLSFFLGFRRPIDVAFITS